MAYRCKSCGYRFKSSDSDLCPECFTARDDITCFGQSDGSARHNHIKDSTKGSDFIAEQMREEARLSGDELREQMSSYTDSIKRGINRNEIPPNTFQRTYTAPRAAYTPQSSPVQAQTQYGNTGANGSNTQQKNKGCGLIVFLIIAGILFHSEIADMIKKIMQSTENTSPAVVTEDKDDKQSTKSSSGKIECEIGNYAAYKSYLDQNQAANELKLRDLVAAAELDETVWYALKCDITISDKNYSVDEIYMEGFKGNRGIFHWTIENEFGTGNKLYGVPLCFPICERYDLCVSVSSSSGDNQTIYLNPDLTGVIDSYLGEATGNTGTQFESVPQPEAYKFNYEYKGDFTASMTDISGSGYEMRLSGLPHEYTDSSLLGTTHFEDESLSNTFMTGEMKICKIMVKKGNNAPGASDYNHVSMIGFDANDTPAYSYFSNSMGYPEVPICSRVKNYEIYIGINDEDGFSQELDFTFTSNDLYDSTDS